MQMYDTSLFPEHPTGCVLIAMHLNAHSQVLTIHGNPQVMLWSSTHNMLIPGDIIHQQPDHGQALH